MNGNIEADQMFQLVGSRLGVDDRDAAVDQLGWKTSVWASLFWPLAHIEEYSKAIITVAS